MVSWKLLNKVEWIEILGDICPMIGLQVLTLEMFLMNISIFFFSQNKLKIANWPVFFK